MIKLTKSHRQAQYLLMQRTQSSESVDLDARNTHELERCLVSMND